MQSMASGSLFVEGRLNGSVVSICFARADFSKKIELPKALGQFAANQLAADVNKLGK